MKTIHQNNFISRDIKDQTFHLPKEELNIETGIDKLITIFNEAEYLKSGFAIVDTSDYIFEDFSYFLDFFNILAFEAERRIVTLTPDKKLINQKTFVYFDSRQTLNNFDSKNAFRVESYRLNGLLRMLFPHRDSSENPAQVLV